MPKQVPVFLRWLSRLLDRKSRSEGLDLSGMITLIVCFMFFFLGFVLLMFLVFEFGPMFLRELRPSSP